MKIGLSLPIFYLAGAAGKSEVYISVFGEPENFLEKLKALGVDSVELRPAGMNPSPEDTHLAARRTWAAGLETTAHSYLPPVLKAGSFNQIYPELEPFVRSLELSGKSTVLTVHSYSSCDMELSCLFDRTAETLKVIDRSINDDNLPVAIALEIKRQKDKNNPGVSYGMLSDMLSAADSDNIGLCWDFGHSYSNVLNGFLEKIPPDNFLKRVIHTHIHDLSAQKKTHWPLGQGRIPLAEFVDALQSSGYSGVYNLELFLEMFAGERDPAGLVEESICILQSALRR